MRIRFLIVFLALLTGPVWAQDSADKPDKPAADPSASDKAADQAPPSENSSSHDTRIDVRPPQDDAKNHPGSKDAVAGLDVADNPGKTDISSDASDVREFHPWNPLKAIKDVEVGDYYFRRKNYKGALERYKDALYYKEGDAVASFRLAECQEKLGDKSEAKKYYEQYLKILPDGPFAKEARTSLARLAKAQ